jgi:hypothetical protein
MRSILVLLILSVLSGASAILFFFRPELIDPIPYGTFTFLFAMIICLWVGLRLNRNVRSTTVDEQVDDRILLSLQTFRNYFLVMAAFFFFDGIAHVGLPALYPNELVTSHMHTFSHVFFFVGNAILIRIPVSFINLRWMNPASLLIAVIGIIAVGWRFVNHDTLAYIFGPEAAPIIVTDEVSGIIFLVGNAIALLIPGLYIVFRGFMIPGTAGKTRAILLGIGMMAFFSVGPIIDLLQNQYTQLLVHEILVISFFAMGASSLFRPSAGEAPVEASMGIDSMRSV